MILLVSYFPAKMQMLYLSHIMLTASLSSVPPGAGAACCAGSLNFCLLDTARGCCENAYDVSVEPACGWAAAVATMIQFK